VRWTGSVRFLPLMRVSSDSGSGFKSPLYDWFDRQYHESKGDVGSSGDCSTSTSDASLCLFCFTTPIMKCFALKPNHQESNFSKAWVVVMQL